jgi:branched-chain amino acid transport system substrate-binding protein
VDEVNEAGGLDVGGERRPVELVIQDNQTSPDLASEQARSLILQHEAVALPGTCSSTSCR